MVEILFNSSAIKQFIRKELGCSCPDEVFKSISIEKIPLNDGIESTAHLLTIGGKLLVCLVETQDVARLADSLEQIFRWGRELRDAGGFNRFRLVVATKELVALQEILFQHFDNLAELDERLHLHVISSAKLPQLTV